MSIDRIQLDILQPSGKTLINFFHPLSLILKFFSAAHMHATALSNLIDFIKPNSRILDVGSGSGYLTACFARLLKAKMIESGNVECGSGFVIGIEHHPKLVEFSIGNLNSDDPKLIEEGKVKIIQGDGRLGYAESAPYDCIHVGAAAASTPEALLDQLKVNGRMIIPVGPHGKKFDE